MPTASCDSDDQCPASEAYFYRHSHHPTERFQDLSVQNQIKGYQKYSTKGYDYLPLPVWEGSSPNTGSASLSTHEYPVYS
jgi:hypothetical protein